MTQIRANLDTPLQFYEKTSNYVDGEGHSSSWQKLKTIYGFNEIDGVKTPKETDVFFVEWKHSTSLSSRNADRVLAAQALGINESANVRTNYIPSLYEALRSKQVIVVTNLDDNAIKNGAPDKSNPNVYELWGGVDDIGQEHIWMEFAVKRYEGK